MASKLNVQVIVGLVNHLSQPLAALQRDLLRTASRLSMIGQGAAQAGRAIAQPLTDAVKAAADLSSALTEVGIVADASAARMAAIRPEIRALARETNQFSAALAGGLKDLTAKGLSLDDALAALPAIGKTSTAAKADLTDMAAAASALIQNLNIAPAALQRSLDILTAAGNEGAFELKDMAREFPSLTAATAKLGLTGEKAVATLGSALQVAMKGAGSAPEAANNLLNLISKLTAPGTVKAAKEHWGVNLPKAFQQWQEQGLNPVEESLRLIQKHTQGDAFKIGEVFGDMQVMAALTPLLANIGEYQRIRDSALSAMGASEAQFGRRMGEDPTERWKALTIRVQELADRIGTALLPVLERLSAVLTPIMDNIGRWVDANPELAANVAIATAALAGFLVVLAPFAMALGGLMGGFGLLAGAVGLLATPLGLTVLAIAAVVAAFLAFRQETVTAVVDAVMWIEQKFGDLIRYFDGFGTMLYKVGGALIDGLWRGISEKWEALKAKVAGIADSITGIFRSETETHSPSRVFAVLGADLMRGLEVGIAATARLPMAAMRSAAGAVALGASVTAMPSAASFGGPGGASISMPITINITAPAGTDAQGLADLVRQAVSKSTSQAAGRLGALYDSTDGL